MTKLRNIHKTGNKDFQKRVCTKSSKIRLLPTVLLIHGTVGQAIREDIYIYFYKRFYDCHILFRIAVIY